MNKFNFTLFLQSMRPILWPVISFNAICVAISVGQSPQMGLAYGLVLSLLASFGFVVNDLNDKVIDGLNNTQRLQGLKGAEHRLALIMAWVVLSVALGISALVSPMTFAAAAAIACGLVLYTYVVRPILFLSNILAAVVIASPCWLPLVDNSTAVSSTHVIILITAVGLACSREMILDLKDRRGDKLGGRSTIATRLSPTWTCMLALCILLAAMTPVVTAPLFISFHVSYPVAITVLLACTLMLLALFVLMKRNFSVDAFNGYVTVTRWAMVLYPLGMLLYA